MASLSASDRLPKANRKLLSSVLWIVLVLCALILAGRYWSGTSAEEEKKKQVEQKAHDAARTSTPVTPAAIAAKAEAQNAAALRQQEADAARKPTGEAKSQTAGTPPAPGAARAGNEPLRMPAGTPTGTPPTASADAQPGGQSPDIARNIRNQARSSSLVAFEEMTSSDGGQQPASPLDKLTEQLTAVSRPSPSAPPSLGADAVSQLLKSAQTSGSTGRPAVLPAMPAAAGTTSFPQKSDAWLAQQESSGQADPPPLNAKPATSEYLLFEGTDIPIALQRAVNSDLPGTISAMVTEDIYDSVSHRYRLIPAGTRLNGSYNSDVIPGQTRVLMAFARMIYPSGATVRLGAMQANDISGASGVAANVDNHFFKMFGSSLVIGAVALAAAPRNGGATNLTINMGGGSGSGSAMGNMGSQVLADTVKRILDRNTNIKPTLSLEKGEELVLTTTRDMILPPATTGVRQGY